MNIFQPLLLETCIYHRSFASLCPDPYIQYLFKFFMECTYTVDWCDTNQQFIQRNCVKNTHQSVFNRPAGNLRMNVLVQRTISILNASNKTISSNVGKHMKVSINNCDEISLRVTSSRPCLLIHHWHSLNSCFSHCPAVVHTATNCNSNGAEQRNVTHKTTHAHPQVYTEKRRAVLGGKMSHLSNRIVKLSLGVL